MSKTLVSTDIGYATAVVGLRYTCTLLFFYLERQREHASSSYSSAHHYSDVDMDRFTPEIIMDTNLEAPDAPVDQIDTTTLMPYLDLKHLRVAPVPAVYTGLQNDNLIVEDLPHNGADDPNTAQISVTPPYADVVRQSIE